MSTDRPDAVPGPTTEIPQPPPAPQSRATVEMVPASTPTLEMVSPAPTRPAVDATLPAPTGLPGPGAPGQVYGPHPAAPYPPGPYPGWSYYPPPPPPTDPMAILGLVFAFVFPPVGLVLSIIAMRRTKATPDRTGHTLALVGTILSGIATAMLAMFLLSWISMFVTVLPAFMAFTS